MIRNDLLEKDLEAIYIEEKGSKSKSLLNCNFISTTKFKGRNFKQI